MQKLSTVALLAMACLLVSCSRREPTTLEDNKAAARENQREKAAARAPDDIESWIPASVDGVVRVNLDKDFKFVARGFPMGLATGQTRVRSLRRYPYESLRKEPAYRSAEVLYGYFAFGNAPDNKFTFVVDDLDQEKWSLYVDANNDNDLTDDGPPRRNEGTGRLAATVELDVEVIAELQERIRRPYRLWFWIKERQEQSPALDGVDRSKIPGLYAACHYAGELLIGAQAYSAIAFEKSRHDALYRDSGLWIDLNRDGKLDEAAEHFEDGAVIRVGGKNYELLLEYP